eukprot:jgi/Psemu1/193370/e_gw1.140.42.1
MHFSSDLKLKLKYKSDRTLGETTKIERPLPVRKTKPSKPMVEEIFSLDELKWFLEEDERPVVIKFHAKWCKKCQKLGLQFNRLAMDMGDRILDGQLIHGDVRFAAIEYTPQSQDFITEDLQINGVPDMQVYVGTHKLLEAGSSIKSIRTELALLEGMSHDDVLKRAEEADDGLLTTLIEDSFYDSPSFLNEEW